MKLYPKYNGKVQEIKKLKGCRVIGSAIGQLWIEKAYIRLLKMSCSFEENKLKEKKDNSSCIFVGSYCSEEINIGFDKVCLEQKYSYCCFNNKFLKILANATRQQGLQNWGSPKNTNCSGILIEHLSLIDFNKINFNELYDDIKNSTNKEEIYKNIQHNLEKIKNGIN